MSGAGSIRERIAHVRDRVDLAALVGKAVTLSKSGDQRRGKCPFHGSKSDSFVVYVEAGRARCWGCGWSGDAIDFLRDHEGVDFMEALRLLEARAGAAEVSGLAAIRREKAARHDDQAAVVSSVEFGRHLWRIGRPDRDAVATYLVARGVPGDLLTERRLVDVRFVALGPIVPWRVARGPSSVPQSPAMVALVRRMPETGLPPGPRGDLDDWPPVGVHVTFLSPDLRAKMRRQRGDGSDYPARKMLGPIGGGGVWLPGDGADKGLWGLPAHATLDVGEGIETVLSGMAMTGASAFRWGLAALSLDNLQGFPRLIDGALPLYAAVPDTSRSKALSFYHGGPVTGLIDADMKPLAGPIDRHTGASAGVKMIEAKPAKGRKPVVTQRTLTSGERARLCSDLFVGAWRGAGCPMVRAIRPALGMDFNDAIGGGA